MHGLVGYTSYQDLAMYLWIQVHKQILLTHDTSYLTMSRQISVHSKHDGYTVAFFITL